MLICAVICFAALTDCHGCCTTHPSLHSLCSHTIPCKHTVKLQNPYVATILHVGADKSRTLIRASELPRCSVGRQKSLTAVLSDTLGNIDNLLSTTCFQPFSVLPCMLCLSASPRGILSKPLANDM